GWRRKPAGCQRRASNDDGGDHDRPRLAVEHGDAHGRVRPGRRRARGGLVREEGGGLMSGSVKMRQHVEREIARAFLKDALAAGYALNVNNGGEWHELSEPSTDPKVIEEAMFATDQEHLIVYEGKKRLGWVWFIYGNDGWDVIADYTVNLEAIMGGAN